MPSRGTRVYRPRCIVRAVDALYARSNFEPIMQSVRDLNKLDDA